MRRRDFATFLGGAAVTPWILWSLAARAQQPDRMRRIGWMGSFHEHDPNAQARVQDILVGH